MVDVRVDGDPLATLPSAQTLRIDWTTGQREPQELLANLPRIMDFLRSAAVVSGHVLFVDHTDGGVAFPLIVVVIMDALRLSFFQTLCSLNSQVQKLNT